MRGARRQTPIKEDLTIVQWNSRSLGRRISEFKIFLYTRKPDIVAIQETWYKSKNKTPSFISYGDLLGPSPVSHIVMSITMSLIYLQP